MTYGACAMALAPYLAARRDFSAVESLARPSSPWFTLGGAAGGGFTRQHRHFLSLQEALSAARVETTAPT